MPGFKGPVQACGNKTMQLLTHDLVGLPDNVRFIVTTRPDAMCGAMGKVLALKFPDVQVSCWLVRWTGGAQCVMNLGCRANG